MYYSISCESAKYQPQSCSQLYLKPDVIQISSSSELNKLIPEIGLRLFETSLHSTLTNPNLILSAPTTPASLTDLTGNPKTYIMNNSTL